MATPSLAELIKNAGKPVQQPTNGLMASVAGATPMQSAMAGTQAVKQAVIKKEDTLRGADRAMAAPQAPATDLSKIQAAQDLATLGTSAGIRVAGLVTDEINKAPAAPAQAPVIADTTVLGEKFGLDAAGVEAAKSDPNSKYNKAVAALNKLATAKDEKSRAQIFSELQLYGISAQDAATLIDTSAQAFAAANPASKITIGQMDLKGLTPTVNSIDDLARELGTTVDALKGVSITDLDDLIAQAQTVNADPVTSLRAQIAALPAGSQQRAILEAQLAGVMAAGGGAAEAAVGKSIAGINLAQEVDIKDEKGNNYTVEQLFDDQQLSDLVVRWLQTPADKRAELIDPTKYAGLVNWLSANEGQLSKVAASIASAADVFDKTKEGASGIGAGIASDEMLNAMGILDPARIQTGAELAAAQAKFDASPIGQLAKEGGNDALLAKFKSLPREEWTQLLKLPAADVKAAWQAGLDMAADPALADLMATHGQGLGSGFVVGGKERNLISQYKEALALPQVQSWLQDTYFAALSPADMIALAKNPTRYKSFNEFTQAKQAHEEKLAELKGLDTPAKLQEALTYAVGGAVPSIAELNTIWKQANWRVRMGDKASAKTVEQLRKLGFSDKTPVFDKAMAEKLLAKNGALLGKFQPKNIIGGAQTFSGAALRMDSPEMQKALADTTNMFSEQALKDLEPELRNGGLDTAEVRGLVNRPGGLAMLEAALKVMPPEFEAKWRPVIREQQIKNASDALNTAIPISTLEVGNKYQSLAQYAEDMYKNADRATILQNRDGILKALSALTPIIMEHASSGKKPDRFLHAAAMSQKAILEHVKRRIEAWDKQAADAAAAEQARLDQVAQDEQARKDARGGSGGRGKNPTQRISSLPFAPPVIAPQASAPSPTTKRRGGRNAGN